MQAADFQIPPPMFCLINQVYLLFVMFDGLNVEKETIHALAFVAGLMVR